ncbi:MAG: UDP-N-acetylmuramoyl-L-alanyl-D-glutamate--2,6-diaminopimelate ligase [Planctomycetota bacterium]|nr:UDP-N-acetylmuramoyl-L-alanyl-D-glutamate--2,6-diaminopimelate ligase [Planctomycetota bacterium]
MKTAWSDGMRWAKPLSDLGHDLPITIPADTAGLVISDIVEDTRDVTPGSLFVARPGKRFDGRQFIQQAETAGAVAILSDAEGCAKASVPAVACDDPGMVSIHFADRLFESPTESMPIVAVTGTNGKTTTATFLQHLLGPGTGLISSIEIDDTRERSPARLTTPAPLELRRIMARMRANQCHRVVMEASSHGIALGRLAELDIMGAIFTNLSGDHLDFHGTMDAYIAAKRALFAGLRPPAFSVVNLDDPLARVMSAASPVPPLGCRLHTTGPTDVHVEYDVQGTVRLNSDWAMTETPLLMPGAHNAMNLAQAFAAAFACDVIPSQETLASLPAPRGRLEPVGPAGNGAQVFVDFAHTDEALETALSALRPLVVEGGRLRVVFGCGGDRDRSKRPRMGSVASRLADSIHVTSDNPRSESPDAIIQDILTGVSSRKDVVIEPDRAAAIATAIKESQAGDVVLIAGKGHECAQLIGDQVLPFDDRLVAQEIIAAQGGALSA